MNKPFTELPAPKRTHRLSIVAVWNPIDSPGMKCESAACPWEDIEEISECPVCGRWMCDDCAKWLSAGLPITLDKPVNGHFTDECCIDCAKLTSEERRAIIEMRARLARGEIA